MSVRQTERHHPLAAGLDLREPEEGLNILLEGQIEAAMAVRQAVPALAQGARLMADTLAGGGRLIYAAAGSSGLMALADALELPGTFGIAAERVTVLFAGGLADMTRMAGGPEDDTEAARADVARVAVGRGDCLIALTASGSTPYPLAAAEAARAAGARTIGLANNAGAKLFDVVDVPVCLPTPPEVIAGSTRMGAGTAQKIALNMLSSMMAMHLGHVHDGMMVNVVADNIKLKTRALGIVMGISGANEDAANAAIEASNGAVKPAILIAGGARDLSAAEALLERYAGRIRPALDELSRD